MGLQGGRVRRDGDLRRLLDEVEAAGELHRISAQVDPDLEIAAVTDKVCKEGGGGDALLFEQVKGARFPVATNLFGSLKRMARVFSAENLEAVAARLESDLRDLDGSAWARLEALLGRGGWSAIRRSDPPCREVTEPPDLTLLPALRSWPEEAGRYLTLPMVFTRSPETGRINCGMYRVQILDDRSAVLHLGPRSGAGGHLAEAARRGGELPVAIVLGGDPALIHAAGLPLPAQIDEASFAGYLRGRPIETTPGLACDIAVPASAEFVLEGTIRPGETAIEGPFGNHTGYYVPPASMPLFRLDSLTRREDAFLPATVVGRPPMEDCWMAKASERILLPLLRIDHPDVLDLCLPVEAIFHGCAFVALRDGADAYRVIERLRGEKLFAASKMMVVVDEGVDVDNPSELFWRALNNVDAAHDLVVEPGFVGVDARAKGGRTPLRSDEATARRVVSRWGEFGLDKK